MLFKDLSDHLKQNHSGGWRFDDVASKFATASVLMTTSRNGNEEVLFLVKLVRSSVDDAFHQEHHHQEEEEGMTKIQRFQRSVKRAIEILGKIPGIIMTIMGILVFLGIFLTLLEIILGNLGVTLGLGVIIKKFIIIIGTLIELGITLKNLLLWHFLINFVFKTVFMKTTTAETSTGELNQENVKKDDGRHIDAVCAYVTVIGGRRAADKYRAEIKAYLY